MRKGLLSFVTILFLLPSFAQQNKQQKNDTPIPDCGWPMSAGIVLSPVSQVICPGSNVILTAIAGVDNGFHWEMSMDNGVSWSYEIPNSIATLFNDDSQIDSLTIFSVSPQMNGYKFRCSYVAPCGPDSKTSIATLKVTVTTLAINSQPENISSCKNTTADFSITVSGSSLTYQWQESNNAGSNFTNMPGKTTTALHFDSVSLDMNNNQYRCVINSECSPTVISDAALLSVQNESTIITSQPLNQTACIGDSALFSLGVTGNNIILQWQKYLYHNIGYENIPAATASSLHVPYSDEYPVYRCIIESSCKTLYTNEVSVSYAPQVSFTATEEKFLCSGEPAVFTATQNYNGENYFSFQWQKSADSGVTYTDIPAANTNYLSVLATPSLNGYRYRCHTYNNCFDGFSNTKSIRIDIPVSVMKQPLDKNGCIDNQVTFSVETTGSVSGYQWQKSTDGGINFTDLNCCGNGMWSRDLTLTYVSAVQNNYQYRCKIISNCFDTVYSDPATLSVFNNPLASNDTSTEVNCDSCRSNIANLFDISGYAWVSWDGTDSSNARAGKHKLKVFNAPGCFDVVYAYVNVHEGDTLKVCRNSAIRYHSNISGNTYQWQVNNGSGFFDITDINGITGSATADVSLQGAGDMQIRCKVDNMNYSNTGFVKITAYWNGSSDSNWDNPLNWSCGEVPYYGDTYVIVMNNTIHSPQVNTNAGCKKLILKNGATVTIKSGKDLYISGH